VAIRSFQEIAGTGAIPGRLDTDDDQLRSLGRARPAQGRHLGSQDVIETLVWHMARV